MKERGTATALALVWRRTPRGAVGAGGGGPGREAASHVVVHGRRGAAKLGSASWRWGVGIPALLLRRGASLGVGVVVLVAIALVVAASTAGVLVIGVVLLVLLVVLLLLWRSVVLLGSRSTRVLSLGRRSLVGHLKRSVWLLLLSSSSSVSSSSTSSSAPHPVE